MFIQVSSSPARSVNHQKELFRTHAIRVGKLSNGVLPQDIIANSEELGLHYEGNHDNLHVWNTTRCTNSRWFTLSTRNHSIFLSMSLNLCEAVSSISTVIKK